MNERDLRMKDNPENLEDPESRNNFKNLEVRKPIFAHSCHKGEKVGVPRRALLKSEYKDKWICLLGYDVRALNDSAKVCGFKTIAIDCYADMDLRVNSDKFIHVDLDLIRGDEERLERSAAYYLWDAFHKNKEITSKCDYLIVGSSLENDPEIMGRISEYGKYIGNSLESIQKVRNIEELYPRLIKENIKFPKTLIITELVPDSQEDLKDISLIRYKIYSNKKNNDLNKNSNNNNNNNNNKNRDNYHFDFKEEIFSRTSLKQFYNEVVKNRISNVVVIKSDKTGGGLGVYKAEDPDEFEESIKSLMVLKGPRIIIQEYITGKSRSCSIISNGRDFRFIGLSDQILGEKGFFAKFPFTYCGNIINSEENNEFLSFIREHTTTGTFIPSENNKIGRNKNMSNEGDKREYIFYQIYRMVETIVEYSGIKGSNGIDFIIKDDGTIVFIEVNPRFQGTLDLYEAATGYNLLEFHLDSIINGKLPEEITYPDPSYFLKAIYYNPIDFYIMVDLRGLDFSDVPLIGNYMKMGHPLCSIIKRAEMLEEVYKAALEDMDLIIRVLGLKKRIEKFNEI
ncbi:MAG: ATP-grasp domain-containing protein [Promethearchaeota archaeon]